ncbi:hypothetical protein HCJ76_07455 [Streptomyces sp. MC1]|uniref:hypothetical protein n=1 Tax=Streptomyces sp. MC1 TaxID=295105 RepID=UPI0018C9B725|nr:hypothetical protein [Streptomyces sp. MC1]MBG7697920.1 hypothetical protein [Streptomyces sp. MC1]
MPLPVLVLLAFLTGVAEVFFDSAAPAIVPSPAADRELERANARIVAAQITGTGFLGQPAGAAPWAVCGSRFRAWWTRCRSSARAAAHWVARAASGGTERRGRVLVVYVERRLGLPAHGYRLLLVAAAVGSLAGARVAPWTAARLGTGRSLVVSVAVSALGCLAVAAVPRWPLVPLMPAVDSAGAVLWNVCTVSLRQRLAPSGMLGRITGGHASPRGGL